MPSQLRSSVKLLSVILAFLATGCLSKQKDPVTLRVDSEIRHQTIEGWSATVWEIGIPADAWRKDPTAERYDQLVIGDPVPEWLKAKIMDAAVSELGLNRFRLEIGPQVALPDGNDRPGNIHKETYRFKWQDFIIMNWLLPLKQRIEQRGEKMVLYISYDLGSKLTPSWLLQPEEYAKMAIGTLEHLKKAHDLEPDYWTVLNEPGNNRPGSPEVVAQLIATTGRRIKKAGFRTRMAGPEVVTPGEIPAYLKALEETPDVLPQLGQLTYHLYGGPKNISHRNEIRDWAKRLGITTAQTEWFEGKGLGAVEALYLDLTEANVSAWEQYGLCWMANSYNRGGGGDYFVIQPDYSGYEMNINSWYLRQFMKYVRPGDVRVGISSPEKTIKPVAFVKPDGRQVVVVINSGSTAETIHIRDLAAGAYEVILTDAHTKGRLLPQQSIVAGQTLIFNLAARGVVTFHGISRVSS